MLSRFCRFNVPFMARYGRIYSSTYCKNRFHYYPLQKNEHLTRPGREAGVTPPYTGVGSAEVSNDLSLIMKTREYCCFAIPLVNTGVYLTLLEQVFMSLLVGLISLETPSSEYQSFGYSIYMLIIHFSSCRGVYALVCILDIGYRLLCYHRRAAPRIYWCY